MATHFSNDGLDENPLVSVIIPAFNVAAVIRETLASVSAQTYSNFEVIIAVDEGSADKTLSVVQDWCSADKRFRYISHPHGGISKSRNIAIQHSQGELVAFLDSDDIWMPEKLSRQVGDFSNHPEINFSFTNYFIWNGQIDFGVRYARGKQLPDGNVLDELIFSCLFGTSTIIVRRHLLIKTDGFDPKIASCEDWDLWLRMGENGMLAKGIREPLAKYRRWEGNHSNAKLRTAEHEIIVLTKNQASTQSHRSKKNYQKSIRKFHQKLELTKAKQFLETKPENVPPALWRAWRLNPHNLRWLLRWALVAWPWWLGGQFTAAGVHRKLRGKGSL